MKEKNSELKAFLVGGGIDLLAAAAWYAPRRGVPGWIITSIKLVSFFIQINQQNSS